MAASPNNNTKNVCGNNINCETTFDTIIDLDNDHIQIPLEFVSMWKSALEVRNYLWIKDPVGSYVRIDSKNILSNNYICGGKTISIRCGFNAPQRVILSYEVDENHFNMRIVDEHGEDIPYYGTHYPTNHHTRKVADPNYVPPIEFVTVVDPEEYIWSFVVTDFVDGRNAMHFPKYVIDNFEFATPNETEVYDHETEETAVFKLETVTRASGDVDKYLTTVWYQFIQSRNLAVGDRLVLGVGNPVIGLLVQVIRL